MSEKIKLIITCDDGGMSPGVDEAVIQLYEEGIASTVSVMSNMPHSLAGLARYRDYPGLEIGAHLNLTEGEALTGAMRSSSLVEEDTFRGRTQCFMQGLFLSDAMRTIIFDELEAQLQVFLDENISPAHITTHHHFHILPEMRAIVYELARKYQVKWIRNGRLNRAIVPLNPFIRRLPDNPDTNHPFIEPDYIVLIQALVDKPPQELLLELKGLNGIIEIVMHPCTPKDEQFPQGIMYKPDERHKELIFIKEFYAISQDIIEIVTLK